MRHEKESHGSLGTRELMMVDFVVVVGSWIVMASTTFEKGITSCWVLVALWWFLVFLWMWLIVESPGPFGEICAGWKPVFGWLCT